MEALTRLVSESFARHGFERPLDYRRLHWSRWIPCESPHSLLFVPSKPGIFALAEEIANTAVEERRFSAALGGEHNGASAPVVSDAGRRMPDAAVPKRLLAVLQFCDADDMAFVLDRMFSRENPMRVRLASGRCFIRYVVLEDSSQRRGICNALNQWLLSSSEATTGIGAHFATSLELTDSFLERASVGRTPSSAKSVSLAPLPQIEPDNEAASGSPGPAFSTPAPDAGSTADGYCPQPFPSGF